MPKFNFAIPPQLSATDAKEKLQRFIDTLEAKLGDSVKDLQQSWEGDNLSFGFRTYGIQINGTMSVADGQVVVDGDLPFSAMMFKGKISNSIKVALEKAVAA